MIRQRATNSAFIWAFVWPASLPPVRAEAAGAVQTRSLPSRPCGPASAWRHFAIGPRVCGGHERAALQMDGGRGRGCGRAVRQQRPPRGCAGHGRLQLQLDLDRRQQYRGLHGPDPVAHALRGVGQRRIHVLQREQRLRRRRRRQHGPADHEQHAHVGLVRPVLQVR